MAPQTPETEIKLFNKKLLKKNSREKRTPGAKVRSINNRKSVPPRTQRETETYCFQSKYTINGHPRAIIRSNVPRLLIIFIFLKERARYCSFRLFFKTNFKTITGPAKKKTSVTKNHSQTPFVCVFDKKKVNQKNGG